MLKDKRLMITGGTGSFGKTVLKRFLNSDLREIVIFSRDEKKQEDMRIELRNSKVRFHLGCGFCLSRGSIEASSIM